MNIQTENNSLFSFEGHMGRRAYTAKALTSGFLYIALNSVCFGIIYLLDSDLKLYDKVGLPLLILSLAYFGGAILSQSVRRIRDIYARPLQNNFTAVLTLVALFIPWVNLIAIILLMIKPGAFSEPELAKQPDIAIPVQQIQHSSAADEIAKLNSLRSTGAITQEDYDAAKSQLLRRIG